MQRRTTHFAGHVQGVGFRYTAQSIAAAHPVTGYVRNLSDGRVELVLEGDDAAMEEVVAEISRQMEAHIRKRTDNSSPATGEFNGFTIKP